MKNSEAKKYNNIKLTIGITKAFISFLLLLLFIWFVYSLQLEDLIRVYISNDYLVLLSFIFVIGAASSLCQFSTTVKSRSTAPFVGEGECGIVFSDGSEGVTGIEEVGLSNEQPKRNNIINRIIIVNMLRI